MTLVVKCDSIPHMPVMFADCLISRSSWDEALLNANLPSSTDMHHEHPARDLGIISGLRRKICIIRPNLIIGWSGSLLFAEIFFKDLEKLLNNSKYSDRLLDAVSDAYKIDEKVYEGSLQLIAIYAKSKKEFPFVTMGPALMAYTHRYKTCVAIGSGSNEFVKNIHESSANPVEQFHHDESSQPTNMHAAAFRALSLTYNYFGREYFTYHASPLLECYGGMYETALYNPQNEAFEYLDNIQISFCELLEYDPIKYPGQFRDVVDPLIFQTSRQNGELIYDRYEPTRKNSPKKDYFFSKGYKLGKKRFTAKNIGRDCGKSNTLLGKISVIYVYSRSEKAPFGYGTYIQCSGSKQPFVKMKKEIGSRKTTFYTKTSRGKNDIPDIIESFGIKITGELPKYEKDKKCIES